MIVLLASVLGGAICMIYLQAWPVLVLLVVLFAPLPTSGAATSPDVGRAPVTLCSELVPMMWCFSGHQMSPLATCRRAGARTRSKISQVEHLTLPQESRHQLRRSRSAAKTWPDSWSQTGSPRCVDSASAPTDQRAYRSWVECTTDAMSWLDWLWEEPWERWRNGARKGTGDHCQGDRGGPHL